MANRLQFSSSPYLQQHKDNPVDWYPWGTEALEKAKVENKPIFLSIGYSSCHWCHVMERESFSDPLIAEILNTRFVSIKVDREERPDLDHIYMTALQMMVGQGGWPLNIFLTAELRPFYGGTYFAPDARYGRPPFRDVLLKMSELYTQQRDVIRTNADQLTAVLLQHGQFFEKGDLAISAERALESIERNIRVSVDPKNGGLGSAPKFFHTDGLRSLLRRAAEVKDAEALQLVELSLNKMACGGVYDHVGGGFHRYSTDAAWQVPHFEKMLYDNALLAALYTEAWQLTKNDVYRRTAEETLDWMLREMQSKGGGFYSAIDADSEHQEGEFYTWEKPELLPLIHADLRDAFFKAYGVSDEGNFEGKNILHLQQPLSASDEKIFRPVLQTLLEARARREWPLIDTKIQVSWNGLALSALAKAGFAFNRPDYLNAAERTAELIWSRAWQGERLRHIVYGERVTEESFLEDYAYAIEGLLDLFRASSKMIYFQWARTLATAMERDFFDADSGGFWATPLSQRDLLVRFKEIHDGALPAAYHLAISVCLRLYELTGDRLWAERAERSVTSILGSVIESPGGFQRLGIILPQLIKGAKSLVVVSPSLGDLRRCAEAYWPRGHIYVWPQPESALDDVPLFSGKFQKSLTVYYCEGGNCQAPSHDLTNYF